ncbi:MAG: Sir2 family NAD-dependent protein deacetylase [Ornithinimicrobium sp.]|uniref:Sir2 family NAD-dependent protein deacetylase n=1 Tax=Ornithinimicrobium sp. TaxID=1977084 RepID=UPI003D9BFC66
MTDVTTLPPRTPVDQGGYAAVLDLLRGGEVAVLTGAGMSTASGIPDYRGSDGRRRVQPMQYAEFLADAAGRRRYWSRAYAGWERFAAARPNVAHEAVADWQLSGLLTGLITQNVDGLHQAAGAAPVIELHGSLDRVVCLDCSACFPREQVHAWLAHANPTWSVHSEEVRPDGDVLLPAEQVERFVLVSCPVCRSDRLKPDVVFFGGAVSRELVDQAYAVVERARALLVLGSSLQVMSGYRFVRRAAALGIPVAVVTRGGTRGDEQTDVHLDALLGDVLPSLADDLTRGAAPP